MRSAAAGSEKSMAVAIFGSGARGDADTHSDYDLLVVGHQDRRQRDFVRRQSAQGWSCVNWSWDQFAFQAKNGSLFIDHLRREAQVLSYDADCLFRDMLSDYEMKTSYLVEQQDGIQLFQALRKIPRSRRAIGWAFDVLMTGFRTWAVPFVAEANLNAYGMSDLIASLRSLGRASGREDEFLRLLRLAKRAYRTGATSLRMTLRELDMCRRAVEKVVSVEIPMRIVSPNEVVLSADELLNTVGSSYYRLRLAERTLLALEHGLPKLAALDVSALQSAIRRPSAYARLFRCESSSAIKAYRSLVGAAMERL